MSKQRGSPDSPNATISDAAVRLPLVAHGKADRVTQVRHDFQMVMKDDLVGAVEGALDRKVIAFMSTNHVDPDLAVEVFVLEPQDGASADGDA
jgi:hypothetical protein